MGEYYSWINVDKKEYICPADFDYGNKFHESMHKDTNLSVEDAYAALFAALGSKNRMMTAIMTYGRMMRELYRKDI